MYALKLPEIKPGSDLAKLIVNTAKESGIGIKNGDIIVVTSKALLKALGATYRLKEVKPSLAARLIARITGKNPVEVELILRAAVDVVAVVDVKGLMGGHIDRISADKEAALKLVNEVPSLIVVTTRQGLMALDGGVDYSNLPEGHAIANTLNFDEEADKLRRKIEALTGARVAVILTDTEFNLTGKVGSVDVAVGSSGIRPVNKGFGSRDLYGRPKFGGVDIVVDELAAAAALLMGQTSEGVPAVIVRGLKYEYSDEHIQDYALGLRRIPWTVIFKTLMVKAIYKLLYRGDGRRRGQA